MVGWARFAVAMPGVYFLVSLLLQRANTSQLLSAGHQLRIDWDKAQAGKPTPAYHAAGRTRGRRSALSPWHSRLPP